MVALNMLRWTMAWDWPGEVLTVREYRMMEHDLIAQKRTAYALEELDSAERAVIEADLRQSEAHRLEIEELRALAAAVTGALATEKQPEMSEIQHLAIESTLQKLTEDHERTTRMRLRRQRLAFWVPTSLAACALLASGVTLMMLSAQNSHNAPIEGASIIEREIEAPGIRLPSGAAPTVRAQRNRGVNEVINAYNEVIRMSPAVGVPTVSGPHVDTLTAADADFVHAFHPAAVTPLSTFPLTVDTSTVPFVGRFIQRGVLPPRETVHVESMINAFAYEDVRKIESDKPLAVKTEISECPWHAGHKLARIVIKARNAGPDGDPAMIVAEEVRLRVEFNPARVASYRLIGYENRLPVAGRTQREERTDLKAGHTLTALYEIVPVGNFGKLHGPASDLLKYQQPAKFTYAADSDELFTVMLRFRSEEEPLEQVVEAPAIDPGLRLADASTDFRFAAAVAQFGLVLLDSPTKGEATLKSVRDLAEQALGADATGDRARFIRLLEQAGDIGIN